MPRPRLGRLLALLLLLLLLAKYLHVRPPGPAPLVPTLIRSNATATSTRHLAVHIPAAERGLRLAEPTADADDAQGRAPVAVAG